MNECDIVSSVFWFMTQSMLPRIEILLSIFWICFSSVDFILGPHIVIKCLLASQTFKSRAKKQRSSSQCSQEMSESLWLDLPRLPATLHQLPWLTEGASLSSDLHQIYRQSPPRSCYLRVWGVDPQTKIRQLPNFGKEFGEAKDKCPLLIPYRFPPWTELNM